MNLDLLKKLVLLATRNPNEHEANAAARRACKLIAEAEFVYLPDGQPKTAASKVGATRENTRQWYGFSTPFSEGDWIREEFTKDRENRRKYYDYFRESEWDASPPREKKGTTKPKRPLKCKTCGHVLNTIYQGLEELFECNSCQWNAYLKREKK